MYDNETQLSVEKYLKAIATMTNSVGKLDVLRCHLKTQNDVMSVAIIESIIKDLSKCAGVEYNLTDFSGVQIPEVKPVEYKYNLTAPEPPKPLRVEIVENNEKKANNYIDDVQNNDIVINNKNNDFAKYMAEAEQTIKQTFKPKNNKVVKLVNPSKGLEVDNVTGKIIYNFVNSNTLAFMIYDKAKKELMMTFKRNGRAYIYKYVPMFIIDNLAQLDETGASAGGYFQQNVVKHPEKYPYTEITDAQYIG